MTGPLTELQDFLTRFRTASQAHWALHKPRSLAKQAACGVGGHDWVPGTTWVPFTEAEIATFEARLGHPFPPEYRVFLETLGTLDRPQIGFGFEGDTMVQGDWHPFVDWRDPVAVSAQQDGVLNSILFDVGHDIWYDSWGPMPEGKADQKAHVTALFRAAPPLLPVFGHRYLLAVDTPAPLPVLSIHQTDVIVWAGSLQDAIMQDLGSLLIPGYTTSYGRVPDPPRSYGFWHDLIVVG